MKQLMGLRDAAGLRRGQLVAIRDREGREELVRVRRFRPGGTAIVRRVRCSAWQRMRFRCAGYLTSRWCRRAKRALLWLLVPAIVVAGAWGIMLLVSG